MSRALSPLRAALLDRFALEYSVDLDHKRASRACGMTPAWGRAALRQPRVVERLAVLQAQQAQRAEVRADRVLAELAAIAFADVGDLFDPATGKLKPLGQLQARVRASIASVESDDVTDPDGTIMGQAHKVKLLDKVRALEMLGKHLGLFNDGAQQATQVVVQIAGILPMTPSPLLPGK